MTTNIFRLQGLSCIHCVKKLTAELEKLAGVDAVDVSLKYAKISADFSSSELIEAILQAGYQAIPADPSFSLDLSGLSCGRCVKKVEHILAQREDIDCFSLSKTQVAILGRISPQTLIELIQTAGYQARLVAENQDKQKPVANLQNTPIPKIKIPLTKSAIPTEPTKQTKPSSKQEMITLFLYGLSCAACVKKVENALIQVQGVEQAQVNLAQSTVLIMGKADVQTLINAVQQAGYDAELVLDESSQRQKQQENTIAEMRRYRWQGILALVWGIFLMIWGMGENAQTFQQMPLVGWLFTLITALCMFVCGKHFYQRAWNNLLHFSLSMDSLIALGTISAWLYSFFVVSFPQFFPEIARHLYFEASAMILGLVNLGKMLEVKGKGQASQALNKLLDLSPPTVILAEQQEREIPLAEVKKGMLLRIKTGERIGVDGVVQQGEGWIDESSLTGEPLAVYKQQGEKVRAGTIVTDGSFLLQAEQVGADTSLAQIIKLVRQAQMSKPKLAQIADKISTIFIPSVILIATIAALFWFYHKDLFHALIAFTSVLIIACPCALGLATPMSIIAGVGRAAELGILVRDADALQKAAQANHIVFDKTGTLTQGKSRINGIKIFPTTFLDEAIQLAASLEQGSHHPLAKAFLAQALQHNLQLEEVSQFQTHKGLGISGYINEKQYFLGNVTLLRQNNISMHFEADWQAQQQMQGATLVYLAQQFELIAIFAIQDPLREDSIKALKELSAQGYQLTMLTGDQKTTAEAIANQVGIKQVIAEVLPTEKAQIIQQLQQKGDSVLMIGDGINDAPALAQADVSIAIADGSDIAIETAELTLMNTKLQTLNAALALSRATVKNIKQNLFAAFVYNLIGIPIAAGVLYPYYGILLNPMIASVAMALSSITVVTNANRLLRFKVKID